MNHDTDIQRVVAQWNKSVIESRVLQQVTLPKSDAESNATDQLEVKRRPPLSVATLRTGCCQAFRFCPAAAASHGAGRCAGKLAGLCFDCS